VFALRTAVTEQAYMLATTANKDEHNERDDRHTSGATRRGVLQRPNQLRTTRTRSASHGFSFAERNGSTLPRREVGPAVLLRRLHARAAV
jgi:hypothetical protein